jgi:hypothetical protein
MVILPQPAVIGGTRLLLLLFLEPQELGRFSSGFLARPPC